MSSRLTCTEYRRSGWRLLAILCYLVGLLAPVIASANTAAGAATCSRDFNFAERVDIEVEASLTCDLHQGYAPTYDGLLTFDALIVPRGGAEFSWARRSEQGHPRGCRGRGRCSQAVR